MDTMPHTFVNDHQEESKIEKYYFSTLKKFRYNIS